MRVRTVCQYIGRGCPAPLIHDGPFGPDGGISHGLCRACLPRVLRECGDVEGAEHVERMREADPDYDFTTDPYFD